VFELTDAGMLSSSTREAIGNPYRSLAKKKKGFPFKMPYFPYGT